MSGVKQRRTQALVDRIARGERLVCLERPWAGSAMIKYYFHPSWQPASPASAINAMAAGEIKFVGTTELGRDRYAVWGV